MSFLWSGTRETRSLSCPWILPAPLLLSPDGDLPGESGQRRHPGDQVSDGQTQDEDVRRRQQLKETKLRWVAVNT